MAATVDGVFFGVTGPINGATVNLYLASRFGAPPQKGDAVPGGAADYGPINTGVTYGGDGAYRFTGVARNQYYIVVTYGGVNYYQAVTAIDPNQYTPTGMIVGVGGPIPAAAAADCADFIYVIPYNMQLLRMKASCKIKPGADTTVQLRKSTDGGATWSNVFGTVTITAAGSSHVFINAPAAVNVSEGDCLGFSITVGGGSGSNLMLEVIGLLSG